MIISGINAVNEDLKKVLAWSRRNALCLNAKKSQCLIICRKVIDSTNLPKVRLDDRVIDFVSSARNLGITFNNTLTWKNHINLTLGKVYGSLHTIWPSHHLTPVNTRKMLAKTLLIPIITFGCEIFSNCDCEDRRRLNVAYNSIARYVFGLKRYDHISSFAYHYMDSLLKAYLNIRK